MILEAVRAARWSRRVNTVFLEWLDPLMAAGHWIPQMAALAGTYDLLTRPGYPSRAVTWEQVVAAKPEGLVLMPCGFDVPRTLKEAAPLTQRAEWAELPAVQAGNVWAVNANSYFSRPGPRLVDGLEMLAEMFHPELFTTQRPVGAQTAVRMRL